MVTCCGELNSELGSHEAMSKTLVANNISCVQASIAACEVSFRECRAFLAVKWKAKRRLKLVLFSAPTNLILLTELLIQTVKNLNRL